jgi:hypothetical protein
MWPQDAMPIEELNWIAIRIFQLDLLAARADLHLIAKLGPGILAEYSQADRPLEAPHTGNCDASRSSPSSQQMLRLYSG